MQFYDNVKSIDDIYHIQEGARVTLDFYAPSQSEEHKDDGVLKYGDTISSVTATIYDEDGEDVTTDVQYALPSFEGDYIYYTIQYPISETLGLYTIKFLITTTNGDIIPELTKRVRAI